MTLRCALYARYSSDQQRAASIEDQFRVCRERAAREDWKIAGAYKDSAISGDSMILRPGIQALLEDARRGMFEILVAEALDRVSRDQADVATLYKHLRFAGVTVVTLAEGEISELHVGLKGTMNALFLKDLAAKTHRGLRGRVEAGKSGGGLCYGYDVVKSFDGSGDPVRGGRTVNKTEAEIVRRVFREFADGASPRAIARRLNGEGIPGPSGKLWMDTTIRGHAKRGTGLINNELYIGRLVWNRLRYVKNPETGKRVSRINPPEEWIVAEVPELRIVDDALWQAVKHRQGAITGAIRHRHRGHAERAGQPAERRPPAPPPALGPARMRRLRRPLFHARPGPLRLLQPHHDRHMFERPRHPPHGHRGAGAVPYPGHVLLAPDILGNPARLLARPEPGQYRHQPVDLPNPAPRPFPFRGAGRPATLQKSRRRRTDSGILSPKVCLMAMPPSSGNLSTSLRRTCTAAPPYSILSTRSPPSRRSPSTEPASPTSASSGFAPGSSVPSGIPS